MQQKGPREIEDFRSGGLEIQSFPASAAQKIKKIGSRTDRGSSVSLIPASVGSPAPSFPHKSSRIGSPPRLPSSSKLWISPQSLSLSPSATSLSLPLLSLSLSPAAAPVNPVCLGVGLY